MPFRVLFLTALGSNVRYPSMAIIFDQPFSLQFDQKERKRKKDRNKDRNKERETKRERQAETGRIRGQESELNAGECAKA